MDLLDLVVRDALDPAELLLRRVGHRLDCVVARLLELLDVGRDDARTLEPIDGKEGLWLLLLLRGVLLHHLLLRLGLHVAALLAGSRRAVGTAEESTSAGAGGARG